MKQKLFTFLCLCVLCVGSAWGTEQKVTYEAGGASKTGWTVSSTGTAPNGSMATYTQTYETLAQMTKGNSVTYTLSGFAGCKIKSLSMSMKSNTKGGSGTFSLTAGSTTLAKIASATAFNNTAWNGSWSTSYVNITPTMTNNNYIIQSSEDIVLTISASANSLFCKSITLTYEESTLPSISANNVDIADDATSGEIAYTISNPVEGKSLVASKKSDVDWISNVAVDATNSKITFTSTPNINTISREATITLNYGEGTATKEVKVTQAAGPYTTIADLFTKATEVENTDTDVKITFGDWVVSAVNGNTAYVTDGEKGFILYNSSGHSFDVGDIISGTAKAKLNLRNGSANVQGISATTDGITKTTGGALTPREVSIDQLSGVNTGSIITINNVTYNGTAFTDGTNNTIKPYKDFYEGSYTTGKKYKMTGMYLQYNTTKEILPRNKSDIYEIPTIKYEISITPSTNGAVTVDAADNKAQEGQTVTMTITPDEHYQLSTLTVTDASSKTVTITDNKFEMPASNVTVSATFAEKTKFTVTYNALGEAAGTEDVYDGELIASAPTPTLADWEFTGWTTNKDYVMSAAAPAAFDLSTPITGNLNLYAVFQKTVGEVPADFDLNVTSGDFTISYDGQYAASAIGSSSTGKISTSADSQTAYVYTFTKVSDGVYTIYDKAKGQYLKYKSSTDLEYAAEAYKWSISASEESGCWRITSGTSGRALIYRTSNLFGGYSTTNIPSNSDYHDVNILGYSTATTYYTTAGILTQDIEISAAGWATACLPFNATITSDNATAYYVTGISGTTIGKTEAHVIPAGTGILLKSNNGSEANVTFTQSIETADATTGNMLKGSLTGETFNESGYTYYILSTGENGIGFYYDNATHDNGATASCAQYKAVLAVQTGAGAPSFFTFDDATAINGISSVKASGVRYNLNGQAVGEDYKGIVIVNGKKMFNK